jgi:hypothetical protein
LQQIHAREDGVLSLGMLQEKWCTPVEVSSKLPYSSGVCTPSRSQSGKRKRDGAHCDRDRLVATETEAGIGALAPSLHASSTKVCFATRTILQHTVYAFM